MGNPHDILIFDGRLPSGGQLDFFRLHKLHKAMAGNSFRQLIARARNHAVGNDAAVSCNGNIAGAGSDIHESNIQHPVRRRHGRLHGGDRLQRQVCDLQIRGLHGTVKPIDDLIRQKRRNQLYRDLFCLVMLEHTDRIIVQKISDDRIADAIEFHFRIVLFLKFLVRLFQTEHFQRINMLRVDDRFLRQLVNRLRRHRF